MQNNTPSITEVEKIAEADENRPAIKREWRVGRFAIPRDIIDDCDLDEVAGIFAAMNFVPFRAELLYTGQQFEYVGYSSLFDVVEPGNIAPVYQLNLSRTEEGSPVFQGVRRVGA